MKNACVSSINIYIDWYFSGFEFVFLNFFIDFGRRYEEVSGFVFVGFDFGL